MIVFPNAKINIGLFVTGKREDGFHNLESIFYPVPLCDALEIIGETEEWNLHVTGLVPEGEIKDNLCLRAASLFSTAYKVKPCEIYLHKTIPSGAGMGGGSADAAFTLTALRKFHQLPIDDAELQELALQLGSDCGFFIRNNPAYVSGRGEQIQDSDLNLKGWHIAIVHPGIHVSTAEAYRMIKPEAATYDLRKLSSLEVDEWKGVLKNSFEEPLFRKFPVLEEIRNRFYENGANYAAMSGSGSAVYGLFRSAPERLKDLFPGKFYWQGIL